ncbi:MAG: hypothetical protein IT371_27730 [Deltaproteobacteria bacterium]|nr:hypothetical protein [Deltaproteobacteria bacterium]
MSKLMTSVLAATVAGMMVLTVAAPNALAFERQQRQQQIGQQQGFRQRIGQGVQKWAQQRWQGVQERNPRLARSLGGCYQAFAAAGTVISGINFAQALNAQDSTGQIIWGTLGILNLVGLVSDVASESSRPRRY